MGPPCGPSPPPNPPRPFSAMCPSTTDQAILPWPLILWAPFSQVATWQGDLVLLKMTVQEGAPCLSAVRTIKVSRLPLRSVVFPPPGHVRATEDHIHRHVVAVGGDEGVIQFWDFRDLFEAFAEVPPPRFAGVNEIFWLEGLSVCAALADGTEVLAEIKCGASGKGERFHTLTTVQDEAPLLSCDKSPNRPGFEWSSCSGESGDVYLHQAEIKPKYKTSQKSHPYVLSRTRETGGVVTFSAPMAATPRDPQADLLDRKFPAYKLFAHSVRWAAVHGGSDTFILASCHASGGLRLQTVVLPSLPEGPPPNKNFPI
mmetsp:Transcript_4896/g.13647  ORF Transcript_4896/g.13647 Transcript_4896/m.13647 type:complete len:314 (-) Transcript_4896:293-1234(-)